MDDLQKRKNESRCEHQPPRKQQKSIASFFGGSSTPESPPLTKNVKESNTPVQRKLQPATAEKWKTTSLAKYSAEDWLIINVDKEKKQVSSMNCKICQQFEDRITCIKGFTDTWLREGSKRLLLHAAKEHAEGEAHKKAYELYLRSRGMTVHERTERIEASTTDVGVVRGLDIMRQKDFELTKKKFETAYFIVKEELPISKFSKVLELEEKHGVV